MRNLRKQTIVEMDNGIIPYEGTTFFRSSYSSVGASIVENVSLDLSLDSPQCTDLFIEFLSNLPIYEYERNIHTIKISVDHSTSTVILDAWSYDTGEIEKLSIKLLDQDQ